MTAPVQVSERVAAGVAWLDENVPGWPAKIDLDELDMGSPSCCVLGQVYGSYWRSPLVSHVDCACEESSIECARDCDGLCGDECECSPECDDSAALPLGFAGDPWLTNCGPCQAEWVRVITARTAAAGVS